MNRYVVWSAVIMMVSITAIGCCVTEMSADTAGAEISMVQNGSYAALMAGSPDDTVQWDFDDGSFAEGHSTGHTWQPGFYTVRAAVTSGNSTSYLEAHLGYYNSNPVTYGQCNAEYRYAVYNGPDPKLSVRDEQGRTVSWLTYDLDHRIVTGIPREPGTYSATLEGIRTINWTITVDDAPVMLHWVRFTSKVDDRVVTAENIRGSAADGVVRYSWVLSDLNGRLVSAFEGKNPSMTADPGVYILTLRSVSMTGSSAYSQMVNVPDPAPESGDSPSIGVYISAIMATVAFATYLISGRIEALAVSGALGSMAMILVVIL
ncbi:MAG: hypothetical protein PHI67_05050 [Candidatus Methanomethylophilaceae archaeon]|nr:hypothetical protein [Candidatus Methanomethylophilaceae archaeon]